MGSNDLMKEMRALPMPGRENLWLAMSLVVLAARAHGIGAIDGTYNDIADQAGLAGACKQGRAFGFDGKTLIHPGQIDAANRAFGPSEAEIAAALSVQAAFARREIRERAAPGAVQLLSCLRRGRRHDVAQFAGGGPQPSGGLASRAGGRTPTGAAAACLEAPLQRLRAADAAARRQIVIAPSAALETTRAYFFRTPVRSGLSGEV